MKTILKNYKEKFGDISNDFIERFIGLLTELNFNKKDFEKLQKSIKKVSNLKWEKHQFIFYLEPCATPRARGNFRTKIFYVKDASKYKKIFDTFINSIKEYEIITTPTKLHLEMFFKTPTSMNKIEKVLSELKFISMISKPDWDNAGKTYSDMIQKTLVLDDCLITESSVKKFYSVKPRIEVTVEFLTTYDCKYNKRKVESWSTYLENELREKDSII